MISDAREQIMAVMKRVFPSRHESQWDEAVDDIQALLPSVPAETAKAIRALITEMNGAYLDLMNAHWECGPEDQPCDEWHDEREKTEAWLKRRDTLLPTPGADAREPEVDKDGRRLGKSKLVYDRATRTIINRKPAGLMISDEDVDTPEADGAGRTE